MINKVVFFVVFFIVSGLTLHAQQFQATAVYTVKTNTSDIAAKIQSKKDIPSDMQLIVDAKMRAISEKAYSLNFNKTTSTYKEIPSPQNAVNSKMLVSILGGGTFYKNTNDKTYAVDKFIGSELLIKDALTELHWKLENVTKVISGYTCYKATAVKSPGITDFRNFNIKKEESSSNQKNALLDAVDVPKEVTVTAWYAPEIPVNHGPENYWGLPGLILEVTEGRTSISCNKVTMGGNSEIKAPANGKVITQKEYDALLIKKANELYDAYQTKGVFNMLMQFGG